MYKGKYQELWIQHIYWYIYLFILEMDMLLFKEHFSYDNSGRKILIFFKMKSKQQKQILQKLNQYITFFKRSVSI